MSAPDDGPRVKQLDRVKQEYTQAARAILQRSMRGVAKTKLTPDMLTLAGVALCLAGAMLVGFEAYVESPVNADYPHGTARNYRCEPTDIVLMQADGTRVQALSIDAAAQLVVAAPHPADAPAPDNTTVTQRLKLRALSGDSVAANQTVKGYVFFPLGRYVKGRVSLEDQATEETEGFVVEF